MNELDNNELDNTEQLVEDKPALSFGEHLSAERKRQNISTTEVAKGIHLSENVIDAIERSDVNQLPQPTFVQGYLRAYAKFLGISEEVVLEEYAQAVPHEKETELQARAPSPDDMGIDTPLVKVITIALILIMVVTALYASFSYYKNAIVGDGLALDDVPFSESYLDEENDVEAEQSDIGYDVYATSSEDSDVAQDAVEQETIANDGVEIVPISSDIITDNVPDEAVQVETENQKPINKLVATGDEFLDLSATQVSWLEVDDANGVNLYYSLLESGQKIKLKGTSPFRVFLGNAPEVTVKINGVSVDIEKYIRSNNIAHFSISVDQQQVVFH